MSKTVSLFCALLCTFIWGTTFIAQDTGMDNIGPFTFNAVRFFVGFLAIVPLALIFEVKKFLSYPTPNPTALVELLFRGKSRIKPNWKLPENPFCLKSEIDSL